MINADAVPGMVCPNHLGSWKGFSLTNNKGASVTWVHLTKYSPASCHMTGKAKDSKASVIPEKMK